jgi:hypothetical protein
VNANQPTRADLAGLTWSMRLALAALVGGPMTWLNGFYTDHIGKTYDAKVIKALLNRHLAQRRPCTGSAKVVQLTERGRWFAATVLGEMADVLIMATQAGGLESEAAERQAAE